MEDSFQREINRLHAQICQGLADPKRILILYTLDEAPQRVTDLASHLDLPQSTVSHHLKVLRERDLVATERQGNAIYYSLADRRIVDALDTLRALLADILARQADVAEHIG
ncbi:MAG: metalloregulator ArsR/SmtB family transcription factor [Anaerolineae bacterium]|jgi:ArsR family transcriptional regulator